MEGSLRPGLGNWVDGDRFFNRTGEISLLSEYLLSGESVSLVAQRRMGKTSLMRETARRLGDKIIAVHVDLEKSLSPEDAVVELGLASQLHEPLRRRVLQVFSGVFDAALKTLESVKFGSLSVTLRSDLTGDNWQKRGDDLFQVLADAGKSQGRPIVVFFDEVPILVSRLLRGHDDQITAERKATTDHFMSWLRDNLIRHRGSLVLVLTGSIGLEPVLSQAQLTGTLNAYRSFEIRPWKREVAISCLLALAKDRELPLGADEAGLMIDLLGSPIPHHVQMFFDHVRTRYILDEHEGPISRAIVEDVYDESMTGLRGHPELSHMEERLKLVMPGTAFQMALALLTEVAVSGPVTHADAISVCDKINGRSPSHMMSSTDVIRILQHDGYIKMTTDGYLFESNLLSDWWRKRFGQGYRVERRG
ncbi:ATP-binding protein [Roseibacterium beibuensis]|uniref:ATP-binding protein n=1 Tax=[Roseibacterium] beibuensis TaxID=1193142 RepID=UPI00217CD73D|nr:ATP-binding protein [Roseibacterium beibuensis]MCS6626465.1 ATP-binding protein [Roseibacterium beibuensis]